MVVIVVVRYDEVHALVEEWLTVSRAEYVELLAQEERGELIAVLRIS